MIEEYEKIENHIPDTPYMSNIIIKTPTSKSQQLELYNPTVAIMNQIRLQLERNQLDNADILKQTSGNTRQLKLRIFIRVEKSTEVAIRQFAAKNRQVKKVKMKK